MPKSLMIFYYALMENVDLIEPVPIFVRGKSGSIIFQIEVPGGNFKAEYSPINKKWDLYWEDMIV